MGPDMLVGSGNKSGRKDGKKEGMKVLGKLGTGTFLFRCEWCHCCVLGVFVTLVNGVVAELQR